ncbi:MAG: hypothetical protein COA38_18855 [Fluviicola sp.]|nr:MAG: hypothetical protein COA38_18855 [Fluviicola sp.]
MNVLHILIKLNRFSYWIYFHEMLYNSFILVIKQVTFCFNNEKLQDQLPVIRNIRGLGLPLDFNLLERRKPLCTTNCYRTSLILNNLLTWRYFTFNAFKKKGAK